jgi:hypothetical protein
LESFRANERLKDNGHVNVTRVGEEKEKKRLEEEEERLS